MISETSERKAMKVDNCSGPVMMPNRRRIHSTEESKRDFCFVERKWISIDQKKLNQRLAKRLQVDLCGDSESQEKNKASKMMCGALNSANNVQELDLNCSSR